MNMLTFYKKDDQALRVAHFRCMISRHLKLQPSSLDDCVIMAFPCRLLVDTMSAEGGQEVYNATMGMLNDFINSIH
jgi:hypothetical protein